MSGPRALALATTIFFLSGCATLYNPATQKKELILIDDATEIGLGRSVAGQMNAKEKMLSDPLAISRLGRVARKISSVSDRRLNYEFHIIDKKELNAFSLPGGFIYINKGLFDRLNDDELAFVLGHEVGHVAARHAVKKIQSDMAFQTILAVALAASGGRAEGAAANLAGASDTIFNLISLGYSRQDEYLSDSLGIRYAFNAGFDPAAGVSALEKIKQGEGSGLKILEYLSTHPYVDERIKAIEKQLPQMALRPPGDKLIKDK